MLKGQGGGVRSNGFSALAGIDCRLKELESTLQKEIALPGLIFPVGLGIFSVESFEQV